MRRRVGYDREVRLLVIASLLLGACFDSAPQIEDDTGGADSSSGDVATVTVRGHLSTTAGLVQAMPGIKVELLDDPDVFAITNDAGEFEIDGVPAGGPRYFSMPPTSEYIGGLVGVDVQYADVADVLMPRVGRLDIASLVDDLQMQDSTVEYDTEGGALLVSSTHTDTRITLDPMPPPGNVYALDASGAPVLDATSSQFWLLPVVVYFNLEPGPPGSVEVSASHTTASCTVPLAEVPIVADTLSLLSATCA